MGLQRLPVPTRKSHKYPVALTEASYALPCALPHRACSQLKQARAQLEVLRERLRASETSLVKAAALAGGLQRATSGTYRQGLRRPQTAPVVAGAARPRLQADADICL